MRKSALILCYFISTICLAQNIEQSQNFIKFFSGSIVYSDDISIENGFLQDPHFRIKNQKFRFDHVEFYKNYTLLLANIKDLNSGKSKFVRQTITGDVNLYTHTKKRSLIEKYNTYYINKGLEELKRVDYEILESYIGSNPNCLNTLNEYRIVERNNKIVNTITALVIGVSTVAIAFKPEYAPLRQHIIPILSGPTITSLIYRNSVKKKKQKLILKAINTYN